MARAVRACWVYKRKFVHKDFPVPNTGIYEFDYDATRTQPEHFPFRLNVGETGGEPPKLWAVWMVKRMLGQKRWIFRDVDLLFGPEPEPYVIHIFPNTPTSNKLLWRVKHLIDIKPVTFPDGEPTEEDADYVKVDYTGAVRIRQRLSPTVESNTGDGSSDGAVEERVKKIAAEPPVCLLETPEEIRNQIVTRREATHRTMVRHYKRFDIYEDQTWTNPNLSSF